MDRHLERYWSCLGVADDCHVFVPLCGKSLDLLWLRDRGHSVSGVELSAVALESFCVEHGIPARRRELGCFDVYEATGLELFCGDFFVLTPAVLRPPAAIYDRAALISWVPELRAAYVDHLTALTKPGTQILLVTIEYPQPQMAGPPFSVNSDDVQALFSRSFMIRELTRENALAREPRLQARGLTALNEVCYALTRLEYA